MRATTAQARRLKRLATAYARAYHDLQEIGCRDPETHDEIRERARRARTALHEAIDEVASIDLTPRAVQDQF